MLSRTEVLQHATAWLIEYCWRALGVVVIVALGLALTRMASFLYGRLRNRGSYENSRRYIGYFAITRLAIFALTGVLALVVLGVAGPVIGLIVSLGVALGVFADSLGGFRVLLLQPFQLGDELELKGDGLRGMVQDITLSGIVLMTAKHSRVIISNRKLFENPIINHSAEGSEAQMSFKLVLAASTDLDAFEPIVRAVAAGLPGFTADYRCTVRVPRIDADSITVTVRFFVSRYESAETPTLFLRGLKAGLDQEAMAAISIEVLET